MPGRRRCRCKQGARWGGCCGGGLGKRKRSGARDFKPGPVVGAAKRAIAQFGCQAPQPQWGRCSQPDATRRAAGAGKQCAPASAAARAQPAVPCSHLRRPLHSAQLGLRVQLLQQVSNHACCVCGRVGWEGRRSEAGGGRLWGRHCRRSFPASRPEVRALEGGGQRWLLQAGTTAPSSNEVRAAVASLAAAPLWPLTGVHGPLAGRQVLHYRHRALLIDLNAGPEGSD